MDVKTRAKWMVSSRPETFLAKCRVTVPEQKRHLAAIWAGRRTPRWGMIVCRGVRCKGSWICAACGDRYLCWMTRAFLWHALPRRWHRTCLCRRCFGTELKAALAKRQALGLELLPRRPRFVWG